MATVDALLAPKAFKVKDKEPEQLLIDYDVYIKTVNNFYIATGKEGAADRTKLAILQAVGGPDMVDLVELVGKVQLVGIPAAGDIPEVVADTYQQAVDKVGRGSWPGQTRPCPGSNCSSRWGRGSSSSTRGHRIF